MRGRVVETDAGVRERGMRVREREGSSFILLEWRGVRTCERMGVKTSNSKHGGTK